MDFVPASSFLLTYGTSLYALKARGGCGRVRRSSFSGQGVESEIAAIEIGKALGARVIAAASSEVKLALCRDHGADEIINYHTEDLRERLRSLTSDRGVDVIYDPVGGPYSEPALRSMAWEGRFLVIGFASGEIPRIPLNLPLLKGCNIVGVYWALFLKRDKQRTREHLSELVPLYAIGKLRPAITQTYPLENASEALTELMERRVKGKIVLAP